MTGPGRRDFTKPTQPGRSKQQPLTPQSTRKGKKRIYFVLLQYLRMLCFMLTPDFALLYWHNNISSLPGIYFKPHSTSLLYLLFTISIHLPDPIVFLTVGFLFPVLAAHIAPLTCPCLLLSQPTSLLSVWLLRAPPPALRCVVCPPCLQQEMQKQQQQHLPYLSCQCFLKAPSYPLICSHKVCYYVDPSSDDRVHLIKVF